MKDILLEKLVKICEKYLGKEETEKIIKETTDEFLKKFLIKENRYDKKRNIP